MRVHYLQHVPFEAPAYMETWLQEQGHKVSATRFYEAGYRLPAMDELDALVIMGGPMGVYDEPLYDWLADEKTFIKSCLNAGKKVLGICLGAQLMAVCLGARVQAAPSKEIGWLPVHPAGDCRKIAWFYELFKTGPIVFHWHGDRFDIPEGAIDLLCSAANSNQAFYYNQDVIGLQFHLEVTGSSVDALLQEAAADLEKAAAVQSAAEIEAGKAWIAGCNDKMAAVLMHWLYTGT